MSHQGFNMSTTTKDTRQGTFLLLFMVGLPMFLIGTLYGYSKVEYVGMAILGASILGMVVMSFLTAPKHSS